MPSHGATKCPCRPRTLCASPPLSASKLLKRLLHVRRLLKRLPPPAEQPPLAQPPPSRVQILRCRRRRMRPCSTHRMSPCWRKMTMTTKAPAPRKRKMTSTCTLRGRRGRLPAAEAQPSPREKKRRRSRACARRRWRKRRLTVGTSPPLTVRVCVSVRACVWCEHNYKQCTPPYTPTHHAHTHTHPPERAGIPLAELLANGIAREDLVLDTELENTLPFPSGLSSTDEVPRLRAWRRCLRACFQTWPDPLAPLSSVS